MVVVCVKTNIQSKMMNATTMIPCRRIFLYDTPAGNHGRCIRENYYQQQQQQQQQKTGLLLNHIAVKY